MGRSISDSEPFSKWLTFKRVWEAAYLETFYKNGKDMKYAKELVDIPNEEIERRARIYLEVRDEWAMGCRHSFPAFVNNFNRFITSRPKEKEPAHRGTAQMTTHKMLITCTDCGQTHRADHQCLSYRERKN